MTAGLYKNNMDMAASIHILPDFLTSHECATFIQRIQTGADGGTPFTNSGRFKNRKWKDPTIATSFYTRLMAKSAVPNCLRANTVCMSGHYEVGDSFSIHTDTGLFYNEHEKSMWTLLIYLNDDFTGGRTVFYDDDWNVSQTIEPRAGMAILFDIDLWHRGEELESGQKFWIGCEIIGERPN